MQPTDSIQQKIRQMAVILGPILVTQIGLSLMTFADTVMSGRYGAEDLAGVAIGSSLWTPVFTGLSGVLLALTPIVAQYLGARRQEAIAEAVVQGLYLAVALAALVLAAGRLALPLILAGMQLEPVVARIAYEYLAGLAWGVFPLFVHTVLRSFIDALGQTRTTMAITLLSLPVNVFFNYVLIFGRWGFPELGGVGAGVASALTYWVVAAVAVVVVARQHPFASYPVFGRWRGPDVGAWWEQLRIGVPIGFAIFFEVGIFAAVALLMSAFGTVTIAAHQAANNFSALLYMVPMSISMALTIVVGFEVGGGRVKDAVQYAGIGMAASLTMACVSAGGLLLFRGYVAGWYADDATVRALVESFLFYVIFFQLSDAVAAPIQGVLRGFKDVNVTLVVAIVSFWVIGLPLGYGLANFTDLGPYGYWIGLISGLASGAIGLAFRLRHVLRRQGGMGAATPVRAFE